MFQPNITRRSLIRSSLALGGASLLPACGNSAPSQGSDQSTDQGSSEGGTKSGLTKLVFATPRPDGCQAGIFVAMDKGFYEEEGIELEILIPQDDYGDVTIGTGVAPLGLEYQDYIGAAIGRKDPLPLMAIASCMPHSLNALISNPAANIKRPRDLEGHTYATWEGPIENKLIATLMELDGGDPSKLEIVPLTTLDVMMGLKAGMFDVTWGVPHLDIPRAESLDMEISVMYLDEFHPEFDFYEYVIAANNDWLSENGDLARAFLRATKRGYEVANSDLQATHDALENHVVDADPRYIELEAEFMQGRFIEGDEGWGHIDPARWEPIFQWMNDNDLTELPLDLDAGYTMEYLEG